MTKEERKEYNKQYRIKNKARLQAWQNKYNKENYNSGKRKEYYEKYKGGEYKEGQWDRFEIITLEQYFKECKF